MAARNVALSFGVGAVAMLVATLAWAGPRDRLIDLATIEISHDLCGFTLSDAEDDALTAERARMVDGGEATGDDIAAVHDTLAGAMARQVPEGLCKPGGAGERLFRQKLESLSTGHP